MEHTLPSWRSPYAHLASRQPDQPILYFSPQILLQTADRFLSHFPGLTTYAVKANAHPEILSNLVAAGVSSFDVASPAEMEAVRAVRKDATLHYNNPVRSEDEIQRGIALGVRSWSVDDAVEFAKLSNVAKTCEISVRFALPVPGAAYDFGSKYGASPQKAERLLQQVASEGYRPSLCFHPGTQCEDPFAWNSYITAARDIVGASGVAITRLNVGGGFAANRTGAAPDLKKVFSTIQAAHAKAFGPRGPTLLCEPGRAMVAESCTLATRIKGMRADKSVVFLNDGIYGGLVDLRDMGLSGRVCVVGPNSEVRRGSKLPRVVFGPTCDSLDRLPDGLPLARDARVGDYVLFPGLGAYSAAMTTGFNGYGLKKIVTVMDLT